MLLPLLLVEEGKLQMPMMLLVSTILPSASHKTIIAAMPTMPAPGFRELRLEIMLVIVKVVALVKVSDAHCCRMPSRTRPVTVPLSVPVELYRTTLRIPRVTDQMHVRIPLTSA